MNDPTIHAEALTRQTLPLHRIKLLDLTVARAGPTCVRHLADWGADVVRIELEVNGNGKIADAYFSGQGCVISQASASMLLEAMQGKTVEEAKQFSAEDMLKLYGARLTPNRQKCCLLSWKVLQSAVHSPVKAATD